jgi:hypothetical protein
MGDKRRKAMGNVAFEVGQVVHFCGALGLICVVTEAYGDVLHCSLVNDPGSFSDNVKWFALVSPAPKPQQRWTNGSGGDVQIVDSGNGLVVECRRTGFVLCHSNVVDVARWLAERDYRCVEVENTGDSARVAEKLDLSVVPHNGPLVITLPELPEGNYIFKMNADGKAQEIRSPDGKLIGYALDPAVTDCTWTATIVGPPWREPDIRPMASLAFAVADIFAHPTRDASRRYVDMAVKALRYEPFAKAVQATLISLVGDRVSVFPSASEIMATIDACHTWEHARGMIAPGKRTLSRAETRELTEIAKLAAWARVPMLDACDIGEIVAETYERARATC